MAITKLFDEDELSEVRKKCAGDGQLSRLLNYYLLQDGDGVEAFMRANNNLLQVFADHIDTMSEQFKGLKKEDLQKLLEIGVEGGKIAKLLRELKKTPRAVGRPPKEGAKAEEPEEEETEPDEPEEELDTTPVVDKWAQETMDKRLER